MNVELRQLFSPRVIIGASAFAAVLLSMTCVWVLFSPSARQPGSSQASLTIIPAPTGTIPPPLTPTPEVPVTPTLEPGKIGLGAYVQISGTEGLGLRIRSQAGLKGEFLFLGYDSEVFIVQEGPQELDGYTWWYLVSNYDDKRAGWAAANYLTFISPPQ